MQDKMGTYGEVINPLKQGNWLNIWEQYERIKMKKLSAD
jgi:hypothetical protein